MGLHRVYTTEWLSHIKTIVSLLQGLPWWSNGWESTFQCCDMGSFLAGGTKESHDAGQLKPHAATCTMKTQHSPKIIINKKLFHIFKKLQERFSRTNRSMGDVKWDSNLQQLTFCLIEPWWNLKSNLVLHFNTCYPYILLLLFFSH